METINSQVPVGRDMRTFVEDMARSYGWKKEEGEGAFEFMCRQCYQQGWQDGRKEVLGDTHRDLPDKMLEA